MQQKVQFIAALLHDPDLVILDEPFSGLDPINAQALKDVGPRAWTQPPLSWHALFPYCPFGTPVSHPIQEQSSEFFPTLSGIQQGASRRNFAISRGSPGTPPHTPGHGCRFPGMLLSPVTFRITGQPSDPKTPPPVHARCAGHIAVRLVAHADHPVLGVPVRARDLLAGWARAMVRPGGRVARRSPHRCSAAWRSAPVRKRRALAEHPPPARRRWLPSLGQAGRGARFLPPSVTACCRIRALLSSARLARGRLAGIRGPVLRRHYAVRGWAPFEHLGLL